MFTKSKIVYLLLVLIFAFTSLAAGAITAVQAATHDLGQTDTAFHINGVLDSPAYSIAGECDMAPGGGNGSG